MWLAPLLERGGDVPVTVPERFFRAIRTSPPRSPPAAWSSNSSIARPIRGRWRQPGLVLPSSLPDRALAKGIRRPGGRSRVRGVRLTPQPWHGDDRSGRVATSGAESNSSFPSAPFWPPGRPSLSPLQTTGARTGTRALRVAATERGDHVANRIGRTLTQSIANGSQVTLHAWVRWLRGHPEILLPSADATAVFEVNAYSNRDRLFTNQNPSRAIPAMAPRIAMAATHHPGGMRSAPESVPASLRP